MQNNTGGRRSPMNVTATERILCKRIRVDVLFLIIYSLALLHQNSQIYITVFINHYI